MSTGWRQRPIDDWPGELTKYRTRSNFRTGWAKVQQLLDRELDNLGAKAVVMLVALDPKDFRIDGQPRANARAAHPGVILSFDSKFGPLRYATDHFDDFADDVYAIALSLESLRRVDRYGVSTGGEQYRGWSQLGSGTAMGAPMDRDEAWHVLRDLAEHDGNDVDELYRLASKLHHPDRGGDADLFRRATEAPRSAGDLMLLQIIVDVNVTRAFFEHADVEVLGRDLVSCDPEFVAAENVEFVAAEWLTAKPR